MQTPGEGINTKEGSRCASTSPLGDIVADFLLFTLLAKRVIVHRLFLQVSFALACLRTSFELYWTFLQWSRFIDIAEVTLAADRPEPGPPSKAAAEEAREHYKRYCSGKTNAPP